MRNIVFIPGEWYHCYNRAVEKRTIFHSLYDYERFLMLLYACNGTELIQVSNLRKDRMPDLDQILVRDRGTPLVTIAAYAIMPNHFHMLLREETDRGITSFMRKVATAYAMYYNIKRNRSGGLFQGKFKARHVNENFYFHRVLNYIHANPAELFEPKWKKGIIKNPLHLEKTLAAYRFSSWPDYLGKERVESAIISKEITFQYLESIPSFSNLLSEAQIFAREKEDYPQSSRYTKVRP